MNNKQRAMLEWLNTPKWERKFKYSEGQNDHYRQLWAQNTERLRKKIIRKQKSGKIIRMLTRWKNRFRKPRPIIWRHEFNDSDVYPFCPACNEFAYEKERCVFCGQRFTKARIYPSKN